MSERPRWRRYLFCALVGVHAALPRWILRRPPMTDYTTVATKGCRPCADCKHMARIREMGAQICERETVAGYPMDRRSTTYARSRAGQCGPEGTRWESHA